MRKAVILFNLGGPDKLENVESFLFNLFNDPAILNLPKLFRYPLAKLIANRRAPTAKKIYEELGGSSPILKLTEEQASALELKLNKDDRALKELVKHYEIMDTPVMPINADFLMKKYEIPEGKQLGEKLKKIEKEWVKNNFILVLIASIIPFGTFVVDYKLKNNKIIR